LIIFRDKKTLKNPTKKFRTRKRWGYQIPISEGPEKIRMFNYTFFPQKKFPKKSTYMMGGGMGVPYRHPTAFWKSETQNSDTEKNQGARPHPFPSGNLPWISVPKTALAP